MEAEEGPTSSDFLPLRCHNLESQEGLSYILPPGVPYRKDPRFPIACTGLILTL